MTNAGHKPLRAPVKGQDRTPSSMLWYLSAPMLILVTPVVAFAAYHNYSYFTVEWFAGLAISAIVGLALGLIVILTGRRTSIAARRKRPEGRIEVLLSGQRFPCFRQGFQQLLPYRRFHESFIESERKLRARTYKAGWQVGGI